MWIKFAAPIVCDWPSNMGGLLTDKKISGSATNGQWQKNVVNNWPTTTPLSKAVVWGYGNLQQLWCDFWLKSCEYALHRDKEETNIVVIQGDTNQPSPDSQFVPICTNSHQMLSPLLISHLFFPASSGLRRSRRVRYRNCSSRFGMILLLPARPSHLSWIHYAKIKKLV